MKNETGYQYFHFRFRQWGAVENAQDLDNLQGEDAGQDDVEEALEDYEDPVHNINTLEGSDHFTNYYYDWK